MSKPKPIQVRSISWQELAEHNHSKSSWIAIYNKVYDVTNFLNRHPGGIDTLLYGLGRDSTLVVETYHRYDQIEPILNKYYIGELTNDELPTFPKPNKFQLDLNDKVYSYLRSNRIDTKLSLDVVVWFRYFLIYSSLILSWYLINFNTFVTTNPVLIGMLSLLLGFSASQIGLHPLHDASHFAVTHSPLIWKVLGATHDFFNGSSYLVWVYQHMLGHHPYTNIPNADPDISVNDPDVRRIHKLQSWLDRYVGQEKYVPFLYGLLAWKTRVQDILILYVYKANDKIRINPPTLWHHSVFWLGKAFFVIYRVILPYYTIGFWYMLLSLVLSDLVSSYWLAITFQVNHVVDSVEFVIEPTYTNDDKKFIDMDWAELQINTTQDYAHDSWLWTHLTGGLNYQAVHHVFPNIHQFNYPKIVKVIKGVCKENNIKFRYQETFQKAFDGHINHLRLMGLGEDN